MMKIIMAVGIICVMLSLSAGAEGNVINTFFDKTTVKEFMFNYGDTPQTVYFRIPKGKVKEITIEVSGDEYMELKDPGFEEALVENTPVSWSKFAVGKQPKAWGLRVWGTDPTGSTVTLDDKVFHSGKYSLKFTGVGVDTQIEADQGAFTIQGDVTGMPYTISGWVKGENISRGCIVFRAARDKVGWVYDKAFFLPDGTYDWTHFSTTVIIPEERYGGAFMYKVDPMLYSGSGAIWFDDLEGHFPFNVSLYAGDENEPSWRHEGEFINSIKWTYTADYTQEEKAKEYQIQLKERVKTVTVDSKELIDAINRYISTHEIDKVTEMVRVPLVIRAVGMGKVILKNPKIVIE